MPGSPSLSFIVRPEAALRFADLDRVRLVRRVESAQGALPEGSTGTVVAVWQGGKAYEVEFTLPFHAIETLPADVLDKA